MTDINGTNGNDNLNGNADDDTINGLSGDDVLSGNAGNDTLNGGAGADELYGGDGNDTFVIDSSDTVVNGGSGFDTVHVEGGTGVILNVLTSSVEIANGGVGDDQFIALSGGNYPPYPEIGNQRQIHGNGGNDLIEGAYGNDFLYGDDGNDRLDGWVGTDYLSGGAGDDHLVGWFDGNYSDILVGGTGNDTYEIDSADSIVELAGEGVDTVIVGSSYTLGDNLENATITMWYATGDLLGNAADNVLTGNETANVLTGNQGNDTLLGGAGNDTYHFNIGDGLDVIQDTSLTGEENALRFGAGITAQSLTFVQESGALRINVGTNGDSIRLINFDASTQSGTLVTKTVLFNDGTTANLVDLINGAGSPNPIIGTEFNDYLYGTPQADLIQGLGGDDNLQGTDGNDTLLGGTGNDWLEGGTGHDVLNGGTGNDTMVDFGGGSDTYVWGTGRGQDVMYDYDGIPGNIDTVQVAGAMPSDLVITRDLALNPNTITLQLTATGESLQLSNWFQAENQIEQIQFANGTTWGVNEILARIQSTLTGTEFNDYLYGTSQAELIQGLGGDDNLQGQDGNDTLLGGIGNDWLEGGTGHDVLNGGTGNDTMVDFGGGSDTYVWGTGSGQDVMYDYEGIPGNIDTVQVTGAAPSDLVITRDLALNPNTITLQLTATGESLQLSNWFQAENQIEQISFADGTTWGVNEILARIQSTLTGTEFNDYLYGTSQAELIQGLGGDDNLQGQDGNDTLLGGIGNDWLEGGTGHDVLNGGTGNDTMVDFGGGSDTYVWGTGSGQDVMYDYEGIPGNIDTVQVTDAAPSDLVITRDLALNPNTITLQLTATGESLQLNNWFQAENQIEQISFADGTVWGVNEILARIQSFPTGPTEGDDVLTGTGGDDVIDALGGNDQVDGLTGNDTLIGSVGNDRLTGGLGSDTLIGGEGNDSFVTDGLDTIDGGAGYDTAEFFMSLAGVTFDLTQASIETAFGTTGNDFFTAANSASSVSLYGMEGSDILIGGSESDFLHGGNTGDPSDLADELYGGAGNDTLEGGSGADTMEGGTGDDTYSVDQAGDTVTEFVSEGTDRVQSFVSYALGTNVENLILMGQAAIDGIGNALNNSIQGNSAANALSGGAGADALYGGDGDDTLSIDAADTIVDGGSGIDTVWVQNSTGVTFNLTQSHVEAVFGHIGNDNFTAAGSSTNVTEYGYGGSDTLVGGSGDDFLIGGTVGDPYDLNDYVNGGAGNDVVMGGEGDDQLSGGAGTDRLFGDGGSDLLDGGTGADSMYGGFGDDTYVVDNAGDEVFETSYGPSTSVGDEIDTVQSSISYTLMAPDIERLTLLGSANLNGTGNLLNNVLIGNSGNNVLDGGSGSDTMQGSAGNDTYIVDQTGDIVTENIGEGVDTVRTAMNYILGDNVENLTLEGAAGLFGTGNGLSNTLIGNIGNNVLDGREGSDAMIGGGGDDTYVADTFNDTVTEQLGEGIDTVISSSDYTLSANIEKLTLTGSAYFGTGNTLDNVMNGSDSANRLDGGAGADFLRGHAGNDSYVVDNAGDQVIELANEGNDTVFSSLSYTLADTIENLQLTGNGAIAGTGNASANLLFGNDAANVLDGGAGADGLYGGLGDDTYIVDNVGDIAGESNVAGSGIDTVKSYVTYALGVNIENLILIETGAIDGMGNSLQNVITGNSADNVLDGGADADTLIGGEGNDTYNLDTLADLIVEAANEGIDTVRTSFSVTLGANLENAVAAGSGQIHLTGNDAANALQGNSWANVLDGKAGADTLIGELGDDVYVIDNLGDAIVEQANEGMDEVVSSIDYTLETNVENLSLSGSEALNGTGNVLSNRIQGNAADNRLDGKAGADFLWGWEGNDTYVVDDVGDYTVELAGQGNDTVESSVTHALQANVENLTLTGTASIDGSGNVLDNTLVGNSGSNNLIGQTGADTMIGGAGHDTYHVDDIGDVVIEQANEGTDTVYSSITYTLTNNVEYLTLMDGTNALSATGNNLNNGLTGNSGDNILDGGLGIDSMIGGAGNDTYIVDSTGDVVTESLDEGVDTVQSSVSYTLSVNVEDLTLSGATAINATGNALNNVLMGNSAANVLDGGAGVDVMIGGAGDDTYVVESAGEAVVEFANEGTDTVLSSVGYSLSANVENLTLTGTTSIAGIGNALSNVLIGNSAVNVLGGGLGADTMIGGAGDDTYEVDNSGDVVTENANEGIDTVVSSLSYTLGTNLENLTLSGASANNAIGNALNNILVGNSGNNLLDGGAGADQMYGGQGNDTFVVENAGDIVNENANEGTDTVQASMSYALGANVENLTLTGSLAINGIGNVLDNVFAGNSAANVLTGGAGNDTYIIGTGDTIVETAGSGTDTVQSALTYTLGANLENLTLTGSSAINGTGNSLANVLTGNSAANVLTGGGGNDTYVVGAGDTIVESGGGIDTVQSSVTWTLGSNLEHLTLTGSVAINGTGNSSANILTGNSANNVLSGANGNDTLRGGLGNDTANGGSGNDTFQFGRGEGQDIVQDSSGSADNLLYDAGINPLDLVISRQANDLRVAIHGSVDYVTVQNWYTSSSNRTETIQAGNGQTLLSTQVDQLIQAMAGFTQQTGLTWDQAIDQQPTQVQSILAASWQ